MGEQHTHLTDELKEIDPLRKLARVLVLVAGLSIAVAGLIGGLSGALLSVLSATQDRVVMVTLSLSILVLAVGLGLALAWHAGQAIAGRPSRRFRPQWAGGGVALFLLAVPAGQLALALDVLPILTFPPFHIAAALLPPLIILALAGRGLARTARWREVVLQLGSGAFLSTFLAFSLELLVIGGLAVAVLTVVGLQPGGAEALDALAQRLQDPAWLQDPAQQERLLTRLAESPWILAAGLLFLTGLIPLIEEAVKTVGIGLMAYRRPGRGRAVLWGLAGGAGFALAEGLLNSAADLSIWGGIVLLRVGASLMHCTTGTLMGLAWYHVLAERRWGRGLALYGGSVAAHGLWNALAAAMAGTSLLSIGGRELLAGVGTIVVVVLLLVVTVAAALGLAALVRFVHHQEPLPEEATNA